MFVPRQSTSIHINNILLPVVYLSLSHKVDRFQHLCLASRWPVNHGTLGHSVWLKAVAFLYVGGGGGGGGGGGIRWST